MSNDNTRPEKGDYFGLCPVCHSYDGFLNTRRSNFFVCHTHRKYWEIDSDLFSSFEFNQINWRDHTEEDWRGERKGQEEAAG
jgi:hypothetical protein